MMKIKVMPYSLPYYSLRETVRSSNLLISFQLNRTALSCIHKGQQLVATVFESASWRNKTVYRIQNHHIGVMLQVQLQMTEIHQVHCL